MGLFATADHFFHFGTENQVGNRKSEIRKQNHQHHQHIIRIEGETSSEQDSGIVHDAEIAD